MKKLIYYLQEIVPLLLVIVFQTAGNSANAQLPFDFKYAGIFSGFNSIVQRYDDLRAVVYYEDNGLGYVSLVDIVSDQVYTVSLDSGIYMNDMCILRDTVFLCGRHFTATYGNVGSIVAISINEFYSSTVSPVYFEPSYWIHFNLKRIDGYEYTLSSSGNKYLKFLLVGDVDFSCDGSEPFPGVLSNVEWSPRAYSSSGPDGRCTVNAVVEVSYPFSYGGPSAMTTSQVVMRAVNPDGHPEIIHDVVVTKNHVAFIGLEGVSSKAITLHICNKGDNVLRDFNPFVLSDFYNYFRYPLSYSSANPFYHACAMLEDRIAIVADGEKPSMPERMTIRAIDLNTQTMLVSQELVGVYIPQVKDVAHCPGTDSILVLYTDKFIPTSFIRDMVCKVDLSSNHSYYYRPCIVDNMPPMLLNSIDAMSKNYFITTGGKYGMAIKSGIMGGVGNCYDGTDYLLKGSDIISPSAYHFIYDQYLPVSHFWQVVVGPEQTNLMPICVE